VAQFCLRFRSTPSHAPTGKTNVFPSFAGAETCCKMKHIPSYISDIFTVQRLEVCSHLKGAQLCDSALFTFYVHSPLVPTGKRNVFPSFIGAETCCKMKHMRGIISDICTV
jgi:hypothetical protein